MVVADDGVGIPERFRKYVFDKFSQADSSDTRTQAGTGLGLFVCHSVVTGYGGTLEVDSTVDRGTTVTVTLPSA